MDNLTYDTHTRLGYEILRDHVLPKILGKHEDDILYWAGKDVARKFPIFSVNELPDFFIEAGWGTLTPFSGKTSKDEAIFILNQEDRTVLEKRSYQLEAGFIAEQFQKLNGFLTECYGEKVPKENHIRFQVKWDPKTKI
ncbi:YslB family protein [Sporosarcina thermotolerans]|uniref:YslB family protein n=1 Tax=Sporosarcina thermotolerans TaxID=633404 RepID=A0AAW9A9T1_9BACL|nr:YslB family protein [Sporosarcina thermotolerans]MDW0118142.1 YslB family protein [Sporosarcina thermotolerans]WHT47631.1 YslB family protein [Sporosarcina thermotolerans]